MRGGIGSDPEVAAVLEQTRNTFADRILQDVPREVVRPLLRTALRGWNCIAAAGPFASVSGMQYEQR